MNDGWEGDAIDVPMTVCVKHARFVPCRRRGDCQLSTVDRDVDSVRVYQGQVEGR